MRACPACGVSNGPEDDFCGSCGTYLGWSRTPPGPSTRSGPTASPGPAPADEPASPPPPRTSSSRTPSTNHDKAGETSSARAADPRPGDDTGPGVGPGREETASPPPRVESDDARAEPPAPAHRSTINTGDTPFGDTVPSTEPPPPAVRDMPGPRPPTASTSTSAASTPDPVLPVRPAKPVAPRPVVRPAAVPDEGAGAPCPACDTPNPPGRRFCRRCATALDPAAGPAPLPWWRAVRPFRRRVRASSGRAVRFLVILAVVAALCTGGFLLLPAGRALVEDARDKLGKPKPVTPVGIEASAEVPRHPATNTTDGVSNRYWGAPAPGASVTYTFREPFRLVDLIIINGASKSPQDYARQARVLRVDLEVTTQDGTEHREEFTLSDKPGPQTFPTGISDVRTVRLVLRSAVGLTAGRHLALAEVEFFRRG